MTDRAAPPVHDLLLALAGRVDDDLLAWTRELVAVGEQGQAVELATAALAAERVVLPPPLRAALVAAGRAADTDLDVDRALPPAAPVPGTPHRFDPTAGTADTVVATLTALPARRLTGCTLHLTWRRTPAGAAPGPLPHPVVLVEADPERSADVLAYLLATELDRAGVRASVEVFTTGAPLPAYHAAALARSQVILRGVADDVRDATTDQPEAGGAHGRSDSPSTPLFLVPTPEEAGPDPVAAAAPAVGPDVEAPRPAGRRRAEPEVTDVSATAEVAVPDVPPAPEPDAPDTDPLNGPLRVPLLAPLLDPTGRQPTDADPDAADPSGADRVPPAADPASPEPVEREPAAPAEVPVEWEEDWRTGEWAMPPAPSTRPASPDRPGPDDGFDVFDTPAALFPEARSRPEGRFPEERFPDDQPRPGAEPDLQRRPQRTGTPFGNGATGRFGGVPRETPPVDDVSLFESPTARVDPPADRRPADRSDGRRSADPGRPGAVPGRGMPPFGTPSGAGGRPDEPRPGRRRRPDDAPAGPQLDRPPAAPVGDEVGDHDRDLLAQLQSELAARGRRPRPYRRAGQNGSPQAVNGHGRPGGPDGDPPPPDLAG